MNKGKLFKVLASESLIYGISGIISRFISIFFVPLYTSIFSPSDYGIISLLNNGFVLITIFLVFGLDNSTARWFYDKDDYDFRKKVINNWVWFYNFFSLIICFLLLILSKFISRNLLEDESKFNLIIIIAITLPFVAWSALTNNILRFERKVNQTLIFTLVQISLTILLNLLFVLYLNLGLIGIFYSQLIVAIVGFVLSVYFIGHWISLPRLDFSLLHQMIKYSLPFVPASLAYWIVNLSGFYYVNSYLDKDAVGLYQIGASLASGTALITNAFQQAWGPFAFSIIKEKTANDIYAGVFLIYILIIGLICSAISVFADEILILLTNPTYYRAAPIAGILCYSYFFIGLVYIAEIGSAISKKTKPLGFIMVISACCLIILNLFLVPKYGIIGAAISTCLAQAIAPLYMFYKSQQLYYIPYNFKKGFFLILIFISTSLLNGFFSFENEINKIIFKISLFVILFGVLFFANFNVIKVLILAFKKNKFSN